MATQTTYFVQEFEVRRKRLVPSARTIAATASGALKAAQASARRKAGTAGIAVAADDETGEVSKIEILGTFGEIPEDFAESLAQT